MSVNWAHQLATITALLEEALCTVDNISDNDSSLAMKGDLKCVADSINTTIINSSLSAHLLSPPLSYTSAACSLPSRSCSTLPKPAASPKVQEKEIFISMWNVSKDAPICKLPATELTTRLNMLLLAHFKDPDNSRIDMPNALRSSSWLPNSNFILSFKSKEDATRARVHTNDWVKAIDNAATMPQHTFAVVAHNAPVTIWMEQARLPNAIKEIEDTNSDIAALKFNIANLAWLNAKESRDKTGHGPLMISFKLKNAANAAIDYNLAIRGVMCSVSIYVPRPPQCFRCQDWGHQATECPGRDRCGRCAGPHTTAQHKCTHENPCPNGQHCNIEPPVCTHCKGDHPSWVCSCPAAKATLAAQTSSVSRMDFKAFQSQTRSSSKWFRRWNEDST